MQKEMLGEASLPFTLCAMTSPSLLPEAKETRLWGLKE